MEKNKKTKFLVVIDGSYFMYFVLFGAVYEFQKKHEDEASYWLKPAKEVDQKNLPNILNCDTYKKILKKFVMKRLETVDFIVKTNFQNEIDFVDKVDFVFAQDDRVKNSFRTKIYPEYKAQRAIEPKQFQIQPVKDYIVNVIFKELDVENMYGYHLVKVDGAEGDDVIATLLTKFKDDYVGQCLIASDHDFLQIDGIKEFNLYGDEVKRILGKNEVNADEYLQGKILMGDKSDNIKQVFPKCGPVTAYKFVKNQDMLDEWLSKSQECMSRYLLNESIISFKKIPEDLSQRIYEAISKQIYTNDVLNDQLPDLKQFMEW